MKQSLRFERPLFFCGFEPLSISAQQWQLLVCALILLGSFAPASATTYPAVNSTNFLSGVYSTGYPSTYPETLPYRYFLPVGYNSTDTATKYPLVIFLHGDGESGTDNAKQLGGNANGAMIFIASASPNNQASFPCIWLAPQVDCLSYKPIQHRSRPNLYHRALRWSGPGLEHAGFLPKPFCGRSSQRRVGDW